MIEAKTKRAAKGGEFGANGEWYEGGKFINTVPENRKREGSAPKAKARKQEIAPYVWVVGEPGQNSIYRRLAGNFARMIDGKFVVACKPETLAFYGETLESVQAMVDRWNAGERWL